MKQVRSGAGWNGPVRGWLVSMVLAWPLVALAGDAPPRYPGSLTVAVYKAFAPFSDGPAGNGPGGIGAVADQYHGIDVAIAGALAKHLGLTLKLLPFEAGDDMNEDLRNMIWKGDILHYGPADVMMHVPVDKRFMDENEQSLIFGPYYRESLVLLHDKRVLPRVSGAPDLIGKPLAVEGDTGASTALLSAQGGALRNKLRMTRSPEAALKLLFSGQVAAVYLTRAQAEMGLHSVADPKDFELSALAIAGMPPGGWVVGLAVKKGNDRLAGKLTAALETIKKDGELKKLFAAEGLTPVSP